jgi:cytochrome subunit of sulfide dehydrogenase
MPSRMLAAAAAAIAAALPLDALGQAPAGAAAPMAASVAAPLAAQGCIGCHGPNGAGVAIGDVPAIAGLEAQGLASALLAFRGNERPGTIMNRVARGYSDAEIAAVAAYFAAQKPQR